MQYVCHECSQLVLSYLYLIFNSLEVEIIRNLEPNCEIPPTPLRLLPKSLHPSCTLAHNSEIKNRIFQLALKIPTVNKHLPVFLFTLVTRPNSEIV